MRRCGDPTAGVGILPVLVSMAVLFTLALAVAKHMSTGFNQSAHVTYRYELSAAKRIILEGLDCNKSLGVQPGQTSSCTNQKITLKDGKGLALGGPNNKFGSWEIFGQCVPSTMPDGSLKKELIVFRQKNKPDPLTNKTYSKEDLFVGLTDFCLTQFTSLTRPSLTCFSAVRQGKPQELWKPSSPPILDNGIEFEGVYAKDADVLRNYVQEYNSMDDDPYEEWKKDPDEYYKNPSGGRWGLDCGQGFVMTSCTASSESNQPSDRDIMIGDTGCRTDDEEAGENFKLQIVCCRLPM